MKRMWRLFGLFLVLPASLCGQIHLTATDEITISGYGLDSTGIQRTPDSIRVVVLHDGTEEHDAWYNASDAECSAINNGLVFSDLLGDLDNDAGEGLYEIRARFFLNQDSLYHWRTLWVYLGVDLRMIQDTTQGVKDLLDGRESWTLAGRAPIGDTIQREASTLTEDSNVGVDWSDIANPAASVILSGTAVGRLNMLDEDYTVIDLDGTTIGALSDRSDFRLSSVGVADIWSHPSRTLTGLGFALDSADFADSCFDEIHYTSGFFDSAQGAAGGLDSADIARAVWNTPGANHQVEGTFGYYLDGNISGIGTGGGAFAVTVTAMDTAIDQTVAGVRLAVRNLGQSALLASGATDIDGSVGFNLDAGSYLVSAVAPGYLFAPFDTLVVAGAVVDTVPGYRFDPGTPTSPSLCRVYGYVRSVNGGPEVNATVTAHLPKGATRTTDLIVSPFPVSARTDSTGYFYLDLIPSESLEGEPEYEISVNRSDGTIFRKRVTIPDSASWPISW